MTGIETKDFSGSRMQYYVLQPVYHDSSTIYVPMQSEKLLSRMRRILSAEEIGQLIREMPDTTPEWVENEADRKNAYRNFFTAGDRRALIRLIRTLYLRKQERESCGKKLHAADERALKEAERLLYDEFALVLQIRPDQVLPFIMAEIEVAEKNRS